MLIKMKIFGLTFLILLSIIMMGQAQREMERREVGKTDSIQLNKTWTRFLTALEQQDNRTIKKMSLNSISCNLCKDVDENYSDDLVPIDTFVNQTTRSFLPSPLYRAIKKRGVKYLILNIPDVQPQQYSKIDL